MRRTPCAMPASLDDLEAGRCRRCARTCVPPQSSIDSRRCVTTRTRVAVLLAEHRDRAACFASSIGSTSMSASRSRGSRALTRSSTALLLVGGQRREVREVEAQAVGRDQRALLRDVLAEHLLAARSAAGASPSGCARMSLAALVVDRELDRVADARARPTATSPTMHVQRRQPGVLRVVDADLRAAPTSARRCRRSGRRTRRRTASGRTTTATFVDPARPRRRACRRRRARRCLRLPCRRPRSRGTSSAPSSLASCLEARRRPRPRPSP